MTNTEFAFMFRSILSNKARLQLAAMLALALAISAPLEAEAQLRGPKEVEKINTPPPNPALNAPPGLPGGPRQTPIDGGLGLLAVAGGAYALRKLKRSSEPSD